jgi:anaerobic magnesium-protoporphyrin IX monomethyl ester cyclase
MRALLINPPSPYLENDAAYPPMGLLYVAASLEQVGCNVDILDLTIDPTDWRTHLKHCKREYDLAGITCVTPNVNIVSEIVAAIDPDVPTMVGGAHPTFLPERTLEETECTFVLQGEAESVIPKIIADVENGCIQKQYAGPDAPIESIPKPARHLVDLHKYSPGGNAATTVYTSRGCPYNCRFCSKISRRKYREFPIARVIEEVNDCKELGFNKIVFGDDNLGIRHLQLLDLLEALKPLDIQFRLNMDARNPRNYICAAAAHAGCTDISFGIESGSQQMLDAMNKQTTVMINEEAIYQCQRYGMDAKAYFMVNFPGETEKTVQETLSFAERVRPDKWLLSSFAPLPGSEVFNNPEKFGIISMSKNWNDYYLVGKNGGFQPCFETKYLTHEKQVELHDMMRNGLKEILG